MDAVAIVAVIWQSLLSSQIATTSTHIAVGMPEQDLIQAATLGCVHLMQGATGVTME